MKDGITGAMTDRLVKHGNLLADMNCLDSKTFDEIKKNVLDGTLVKLFCYIQRLMLKSSTLEKFRGELKDFANKWNKLKNSLEEDFDRIFGDGDDSSSDRYV